MARKSRGRNAATLPWRLRARRRRFSGSPGQRRRKHDPDERESMNGTIIGAGLVMGPAGQAPLGNGE